MNPTDESMKTLAPMLGAITSEAWLHPSDPTLRAEYWVTRRSADATPGYGGFNEDIRAKHLWSPTDNAWVSGSYWTRQGYRPGLVCLHQNNGWRIDENQNDPAEARDRMRERD